MGYDPLEHWLFPYCRTPEHIGGMQSPENAPTNSASYIGYVLLSKKLGTHGASLISYNKPLANQVFPY